MSYRVHVAVFAIFAASTFLILQTGQTVAQDNSWNWEKVPAETASAVADQTCTVKVGAPYEMKDYGPRMEFYQGLKTAFAPTTAARQRVLNMVPVSSVSLDEWREIRREFSRNPPANFAIVGGGWSNDSDDLVGVPVKWEDGVASSMEAIWEHQDGAEGNIEKQVTEIFARSAALHFGEKYETRNTWYEFVVRHSDKNGETTPFWNQIFLNKPDDRLDMTIYMGFSRMPKVLKDRDVARRVITVGGAFGENLGSSIAAWPTDRASASGQFSPGCTEN